MKKNYIHIINSYFKKTDQLFKSNKSSKRGLYILIAIFFILIFILNRLYPLFSDDWSYSFIIGGTDKIKSLNDIFVSQYNHYFMWGGRTIVHIINQILLMLPLWIADLLNSLAYIYFTFLIYKFLSFNSKKENPLLFIMIQFSFWFLLPTFSDTVLWRTGSANYLWGSLILFSFLYLYCKLFFKPEYRNVKGFRLKPLVLFLFGIIAGWTNENTAIAVIVGCILILVWLKTIKAKIPMWCILGLIGAIIGYLMMVLAPGNYIRYDSSIGWHFDSKIDYFVAKLFMFSKVVYHRLLPILLYFSLALVIFLNLNKSKEKQKQLFSAFFFFLLGLISFVAMIAAPIFPERVWFGIWSFFILAILQLINIDGNRLMIQLQLTVICFLSFCYIFSYRQAAIELNEISSILNDREQIINTQTNKKEFDFVATKKIHRSYNFSQLIEIPSDSTNSAYWVNKIYCSFYGIRSFKVDDPNEKDDLP